MAITYELRELYNALEEDQWRKNNTFSEEMSLVHAALFNPYSRYVDKIEFVERWLQRHQPCLFGRIAATDHRMHICILTDQDIFTSDEHVAEKVRAARLAWKRRSFRPIAGMAYPAHGFLLLLASKKVAFAAPDRNLQNLALKLRELWGCETSQTNHGSVSWETLFLSSPNEDAFLKFTFSIDFFAAQGDGRWWQDHRVPGGIAFTANSVGHMRRYREMYDNKGDQAEWILATAMRTIDFAQQTQFGRATWLMPLANGKPYVKRMTCPFADPAAVSQKLQGFDWTRYGGHLHTDHSIRSEFFHPEPQKSKELEAQRWLEDFLYLYDPTTNDHAKFSAGEIVGEEEVINAIGDPEDFASLEGPIASDEVLQETAPHSQVQELLARSEQWKLRQSEIDDINGSH